MEKGDAHVLSQVVKHRPGRTYEPFRQAIVHVYGIRDPWAMRESLNV